MSGDSKHEIINNVNLKWNGELHRFKNFVGVPYSAIYQNGVELYSCERFRESSMIKEWNRSKK